MTTEEDNRHTIDVFSSSLLQHGHDFRALNWGSQKGQENRFRILCEIGIETADSVLDVGCGLGDLYGYLKKRGTKVDYSGLDITPDMIAAARDKFPEAQFREGSLLDATHLSDQSFDYVIASGIFYLRRDKPFQHLERSVRRMFELCRKGVAFNCLSTWAEPADDGSDEYREDPVRCLEFCRTLSPWTVLRTDYHPGDFTLYLRRQAQQS